MVKSACCSHRMTSPAMLGARMRAEETANEPPSLGSVAYSRRAGRLAAAGSLAIALAAGCSSANGVDAQSGPAPSTTTTISSPPVVRSSSTAAPGRHAAIAQVVQYERVLDDLFLHPHLSFTRLYDVATQPDVTDEISFLNQFRQAGDRQTGRAKVIAVRVRSQSPATVTAVACIRVSEVQAFGPDGQSVVPAHRLPYYLTTLRLRKVHQTGGSRWLVSTVRTQEVHQCGS